MENQGVIMQKLQYRSIKDLKKLPGNPRTIKEKDMDTLVKSIKDNPDYFEARPLILSDRTGELIILAGNQRYEAARMVGLEQVPTYLLENLTPEREQEIIIRDNISNGEWDWDVLTNEWDTDLLDLWGLELPADWKPEDEVVEDEAPEVSSDPPISVLGEIYQLGRHRVMCGDSTDKANVELLMNGVKADMVFTDPPYGMFYEADWSTAEGEIGGRKSKGKKYDNVIGDHQEYDPAHIFGMFGDCKEIFLWGADYYAERIPNKNEGSWLVWDKTLTESADKGFGSNFELCWSKNRHKREIARIKWQGFFGLSADDTKSRVHPTQKPAELARFVLDKWADKLEIVVDLFLGSGSTLIACEQTDRTCYGMELDPKYVDVIRKRYVKLANNGDLPDNWQELTPPCK